MTTEFLNYSKWPKVEMDIGNELGLENSKYAFLLGSALRNQDTELFIQVYDVVLPKSLSVEEVNSIKEVARHIGGLSQAEFSKLAAVVCDSNRLALAAGVMSDSQQAAIDSDLNFIADEMDRLRPDLQSLERTSRHFNQKCDGADPEEGEGEYSDSGVFNSSKNTVGSTSDNELTDESDRPGCIDYFPEIDSYKKYTPPKVTRSEHIRQQHSVAYDVVEDVESDSASQKDFESPQDINTYDGQDEELSEVVVHKNQYGDSYCYGMEMTTFRTSCSIEEQNRNTHEENSAAYDEAVNVDDDDNDDNLSGVSVHQKLYRSGKSCDFTHMDAEDEEEYETDPRPVNIHFTPHRPLLCRSSFSLTGKTTKDIDRTVSFPLNNRSTYSDNKYSSSFPGIRTSRASDGTCIEERIKSRSPPFGDPVSVRAVNRSAEELIECSPISSDRLPSNLPFGAPVGNNTEESGSDERRDGTLSEGTGKKKRKKKKASSKDDGGGDSKEASYDVNGNPVEQRSSLGLFSSSEKHVEVTNRDGRSLPRQDAQISHFPKDISSLVELTPGSSLANMDMQSSSDPQGKHSRFIVRKKREEIKTVKSENIPGHRGSESNLDDLLDFIQGGKKKKKLLPVQNGSPAVLDKDKNNIKKIKKGKLPYNKDGSDRAGSDNGSDKSEDPVSRDFDDKKLSKLVTQNSSRFDLKDSMVPLTRTGEDHRSRASLTLDVFNAGGSYIFTDFDSVPPVEEEFQVVGKPKKKKQQRPGPSLHGSYRESSLDFAREDRGRSRRPMRSITPPPTPTTSQEKPSERAFSPSAFPVLSGRPREGRRNSTGNAPCEPNLDDSDMESVKSLPLVAGSSSTSTKTSGNTSPGSGRPQVISYAKIAAAPKPNKACPNSSCSNAAGISTTSAKGNVSGLPLVNVNPNAERRHSLDSSPQPELGSVASPVPVDCPLGDGSSVDNAQGEIIVITKEFPPPTTPTSVASVSQEEGYQSTALPKSDSEIDSLSVASNTSSNSRSFSISESRSKEEIVEHGPVIKLDLDTDFPHISKNVSVNNKNKAAATQQLKSTKNNVGNNKKQIASTCKDIASQNVLVHVSDNNITKDKVVVASSLTCVASTDNKLDSVSVESNMVTTKPPLAPKITNNHRKLKVQKPVYFLDNKMNKPPKDLGISFGFDHDLSTPMQDALVDGTGVPSNFPVDNGVLPAEDVSLKLKEGLAGLNGLVVVHTNTQGATTTPSLNPYSPVGKAKLNLKTDGSSSQNISAKRSTHMQGLWHTCMPYTPPAPNVCMPQFGDVKISHYITRRPPPPEEDPNFNCGKFNMEETVIFLKREWDRVMEKKAKDPRRVIYYSCD